MKQLVTLLSTFIILFPYVLMAADTHSANWGTTAYGTASDAATLDIGSANNATFEFWMYPTAQPTGNAIGAGGYADFAMMTKWQAGQTPSYYIGYGYDAVSAKQICMWMNDGTGNKNSCVNITAISNNTWGYIAIVYNDSTGNFEVFQGDEATCPTSKGTASGFLGMQDGTSRLQVAHGDNVTATNFQGYFGEARIWRTTKTATELGTSWTPSTVTSGTNLLEVWTFDNTWNASVNANNLTTTNSPTFTTTKPTITASCSGGGGGATTPADETQVIFSLRDFKPIPYFNNTYSVV